MTTTTTTLREQLLDSTLDWLQHEADAADWGLPADPTTWRATLEAGLLLEILIWEVEQDGHEAAAWHLDRLADEDHYDSEDLGWARLMELLGMTAPRPQLAA